MVRIQLAYLASFKHHHWPNVGSVELPGVLHFCSHTEFASSHRVAQNKLGTCKRSSLFGSKTLPKATIGRKRKKQTNASPLFELSLVNEARISNTTRNGLYILTYTKQPWNLNAHFEGVANLGEPYCANTNSLFCPTTRNCP